MLREPRGPEKKVSVHPVLPPELLQFLNRRSYSLLIKGEAATGKTILALSILKELGDVSNYLYLSTRVSPSQLFENHPWLSELVKARKPESGEDAKRGRIQDRFVDARLDEPVPFFERMTNELMDVRSPTIVVDTWDPIGTMMEDDALLSNTKVLQTWRERAEAKLIVLIEDSANNTFDSLFDGVVAMDRYYEEGRIVRMVHLSKLSGVKVNRPSPLFTLDESVFQSFRTYRPLDIDAQKPASWAWERRARSTGYRELDAAFDGTLPSGTIMHLNVNSGVNSRMVLLLLSGIIGRGDSRSRAILFRPFEGIGLEQARGAFGEATPIVRARLRGKNGSGDAETWAKTLKGMVKKQKEARKEKRLVVATGSELLLDAGGEEEVEDLLELMKSEIDLSVIVTGSGNQLEKAARVADVSLRLSDINGTPLLEGELPWTEYFGITAKARNGGLALGLVPMV
jgi:KaiC/GvpD/RAD55 family RecA-like ATPase